MRKEALIILSRYLWPVDGGRKESLNHYLKELYDHYNYNITVLCFLEAGQEIKMSDWPYYIDKVEALKDADILEKAKNILWHSLIKEKWPLQCSLYFSKKNERTIQEYVEALKPSLIFTEMIRTCTYINAFRDSKALKLANIDDLLSLRYERQRAVSNSSADFAGAYGEKLPGWLKRLASGKLVKNIILRMEAKRCSKWEDIFYKEYDYSLMTSNIERDILNHRLHGSKAKTLTVGVDCNYYGESIDEEKEQNTLSYVGNFSVASNADTLQMMTEKILPLLKSDYKFYVIGKCPEAILNKYKANHRIIFCGRVDDIRKYVKKTCVFFSPIAYGTGVKTKIVEAMSMGMPIVTNSAGVEGIHAEKGNAILVSDDYNEIAQYTDCLLLDSDLREKIGANARKFAQTTFRWEKVFEVFKEMNL